MREETRRKLDALTRFRGSDRWMPFALGAGALALSAFYVAHNIPTAERLVPGTVQRSLWRIEEGTGQSYPQLYVTLDDGGLVAANALQPELPAMGTKIVLRERTWASGFRTYNWEGPVSEAGP